MFDSSVFLSEKTYVAKISFSAGKSSVLLDVKPWDDETDMKKLEEAVKSIKMEGLLWGACMFLYPVFFEISVPVLINKNL